jgi:hypothetical protein
MGGGVVRGEVWVVHEGRMGVRKGGEAMGLVERRVLVRVFGRVWMLGGNV